MANKLYATAFFYNHIIFYGFVCRITAQHQFTVLTDKKVCMVSVCFDVFMAKIGGHTVLFCFDMIRWIPDRSHTMQWICLRYAVN